MRAAIDGGDCSQMLAKGWAHAPSLASSAQLTIGLGHLVRVRVRVRVRARARARVRVRVLGC